MGAMKHSRADLILRHIRRLVAAHTVKPLQDQELLRRFVARRAETAFAALMQRHGPMVLGVCRRLLGDAHDAEDTCQATFLVLARRAGSIRKQGSLGSWLHGVAYRLAQKAKGAITRRRTHERQALSRPPADPATDVSSCCAGG